ncbi:MAG TPA: hypothetical protein PK687_08035 [Candidatus Avimonas sp.]|nr:hypothetical protein [Candidatus Avimonas sp.]
MAYNTKSIKKDVDGKPIPQYFNPLTDQYEELRGTGGASRTILYDNNGNPVLIVNGKLSVIVDPVKLAGNDTMLQGNITLTGTAQQLHSNTPCKIVTIQAHPDNAGYVYVGKSNVSITTHMAVLTPGSFFTITATNLNLIYVRGTAGDKISYGGEV